MEPKTDEQHTTSQTCRPSCNNLSATGVGLTASRRNGALLDCQVTLSTRLYSGIMQRPSTACVRAVGAQLLSTCSQESQRPRQQLLHSPGIAPTFNPIDRESRSAMPANGDTTSASGSFQPGRPGIRTECNAQPVLSTTKGRAKTNTRDDGTSQYEEPALCPSAAVITSICSHHQSQPSNDIILIAGIGLT
jgi:hypothetical protein